MAWMLGDSDASWAIAGAAPIKAMQTISIWRMAGMKNSGKCGSSIMPAIEAVIVKKCENKGRDANPSDKPNKFSL